MGVKFYYFHFRVSIRCIISSLKKSITGANESASGSAEKYREPLR
jgi:hypothetical protein